ncbi:HEPN domain-containing protein [Streptomyces sp. NPDC052179]|uniref:HEPN domain-containing protein n=1 Tax=Streptomyces sp. NPDC052179 TaxID=3155680 RepID=UPI00341FEE88
MSPVEVMYRDHKGVLEYLGTQQEVSHLATLQTTLPKVLLLAAASEFEVRVCRHLRDHVTENVLDSKIIELVDQKVIRFQYHKLFDWDAGNAGKFWSLFGREFKLGMKQLLTADDDLATHTSAFMEIGSLRNNMVHNNYAKFVLMKTLDEVYELYLSADLFVKRIPELLQMNFERSD